MKSNSPSAASLAGQNVKLLTFTGIMAALLCVLCPLSIPVGPVPVSLTVFVVFLSVYALGRRLGTLSYVIYLLLGLFGLPVFSGFMGGPAKLFGPTGGYLFGMIAMAWIAGIFIDRFTVPFFEAKGMGTGKSRLFTLCLQAVGMILGDAVNYVIGTAYFLFTYTEEITLLKAMQLCVFPFIVIDLIKIALCLLVGNTLRKSLSLAGLMRYGTQEKDA